MERDGEVRENAAAVVQGGVYLQGQQRGRVVIGPVAHEPCPRCGVVGVGESEAEQDA